MYMSRYRTALSIVRDRQALQAEFLKSVIVGILIALIFFGRLFSLQMYVCMYEGHGMVIIIGQARTTTPLFTNGIPNAEVTSYGYH